MYTPCCFLIEKNPFLKPQNLVLLLFILIIHRIIVFTQILCFLIFIIIKPLRIKIFNNNSLIKRIFIKVPQCKAIDFLKRFEQKKFPTKKEIKIVFENLIFLLNVG